MIIYIPEGRGRVSLSGTQKSDAITSICIECTTFVTCCEFWWNTTNGLLDETIIFAIDLIFLEFYLNTGIGNACAGHIIVKLVLNTALKLLELSTDGNFGETRPTGSKEIRWRQINVPEGWGWKRLSRAEHCHTRIEGECKTAASFSWWKFRWDFTHRFCTIIRTVDN